MSFTCFLLPVVIEAGVLHANVSSIRQYSPCALNELETWLRGEGPTLTWCVLINYHLLCYAHIRQSSIIFCTDNFTLTIPYFGVLQPLQTFNTIPSESFPWFETKTYSWNVAPTRWSLSHPLGWNRSIHPTDTCHMGWWINWWQSTIAVHWHEGGKEMLCLWALWVSADNRVNNKGWVNITLQTWGWLLRLNSNFSGLESFKIPCTGLDLNQSIIYSQSCCVLFLICIGLAVQAVRL